MGFRLYPVSVRVIFPPSGDLGIYFAGNQACLFHGPEVAGQDFLGYAVH